MLVQSRLGARELMLKKIWVRDWMCLLWMLGRILEFVDGSYAVNLVDAKEVAIVSTGAGAVGSKVSPSGGSEDMMVQMKGVKLAERVDKGVCLSHIRDHILSQIFM